MTAIVVLTTVATREDARRLGRELVERGLVACAQISEIESFYRWDGSLQHDPEFRLLLKTVEARYEQVEAALRELHPYDLPAIHAMRLERVEARYGAWIESQCGG